MLLFPYLAKYVLGSCILMAGLLPTTLWSLLVRIHLKVVVRRFFRNLGEWVGMLSSTRLLSKNYFKCVLKKKSIWLQFLFHVYVKAFQCQLLAYLIRIAFGIMECFAGIWEKSLFSIFFFNLEERNLPPLSCCLCSSECRTFHKVAHHANSPN